MLLIYFGQNNYIRTILPRILNFVFINKLMDFKMIELSEGKSVITLHDECYWLSSNCFSVKCPCIHNI